MKRLVYRLKVGWYGETTWEDRNHWVQFSGETVEELADRIAQWAYEKGEELINDLDEDDEAEENENGE